MLKHEVTETGESRLKWAMAEPGFMGSIKQLVCCGRCGDLIQKPHDQARHVFDAFGPSMHWICDQCLDALPE